MYQFNLKFVNPTSPFDVNKEQIVELRNLADREYYRADNPSAKIGSSDIELKNYLINLNIGENLFESIDNYKALLKGNSDIAIKLLFDKCFYFEMKEINTSRFYRSLYGLFQVILKDHEFPDKNHFEKIYRYYSKTYLSFQSIHVKKLYNKVSGKAV